MLVMLPTHQKLTFLTKHSFIYVGEDFAKLWHNQNQWKDVDISKEQNFIKQAKKAGRICLSR